MEKSLLERINSARNNPVEALLLQDLDPLKLSECHPELTEYMDSGLNGVFQDTRLFKTAAAHAQEMASEGYFSKISLDGSTVNDRYIQASFFADAADEVIGIVLFQNYLSKDKALNALWKGMLENELNCEEQPDTILFKPEFTEIGISVQSGSMDLNGTKFNFYIAVCDFGQDQVRPDEKKSFFVVNQIRSAPDTIKEPIEIVMEPPYNNLLPFRFDNRLFYTAEQLNEWVMAGIINSEDPAEEPLSLDERLGAFGYEASCASEIYKVWITIDEKTSDEIRQYFLEQLFSFESDLPADKRVMLNEIFTEAGLAILSKKAVLDDDEYYIHIIAVVAALPEVSEKFVCTGLVLESEPQTDEEVDDSSFAGILLKVSNLALETSQLIFTGQSDEFSIELIPGEYILSAPENEGFSITEKNITITDQNIFIVLECQNSENALDP